MKKLTITIHLIIHDFLSHNSKPIYRKVPKFSDSRKVCCNLSKVQIERQFGRKNCVQSADAMTNSVDPLQTAPLGAV